VGTTSYLQLFRTAVAGVLVAVVVGCATTTPRPQPESVQRAGCYATVGFMAPVLIAMLDFSLLSRMLKECRADSALPGQSSPNDAPSQVPSPERLDDGTETDRITAD
jgi:hypothetical protein